MIDLQPDFDYADVAGERESCLVSRYRWVNGGRCDCKVGVDSPNPSLVVSDSLLIPKSWF